MYIADETVVGDKDSALVCLGTADHISTELPAYVQFVRIYLDSALYVTSKYIGWWATEIVYTPRFIKVTLSFIVPGHTKYEVRTGCRVCGDCAESLQIGYFRYKSAC